jgi:hypothetical protein
MATKRKTATKAPAKKKRVLAKISSKKENRLNNPYGVNQYTEPDPRQALFLSAYLDPKSPTFSNGLQSAIKAGYSQEYAEVLTSNMPAWLSENIRRTNFVHLAEEHMNEVLTMPNLSQAMGAFGPIFSTEITKVKKTGKNGKVRTVNKKVKVPVIIPQISLIKEKTAIAKIVLPAHDPKVYGRDSGPKVSFSFNFKADQEKYAA